MKTRASFWTKIAVVGAILGYASGTSAQSVAVSGKATADGEGSVDGGASAEAAPGDADSDDADVPDGEAAVETASDSVPENTVERCGDQIDNDGDAHVDCNDQDCEIFAICVADPQPSTDVATTAAPAGVTRVTVFETEKPKETGRACADLVDNDENGLTDCEEPQCRRYRYCRKEMYHYPADPNRPPGVFVNFGFGVAFPNYRYPRAEIDSVYGNNISFDPDLGGMLDLQTGVLFHKFVGAGVNLKWAITGGTNHEVIFSEQDDDEYKYLGLKHWGNVGGFVRLQWPFERVVPYVNIHAGFSWAKHRLHVYDGENTWSDIEEHESDDSWPVVGEKDVVKPDTRRHFTFALEPGFDVQVIKQFFGVGVRAWLPVVASKDSDTDNVGLLLNFSFTPTWRGHKTLKDKYKNAPASASAAAPTASPTPAQ